MINPEYYKINSEHIAIITINEQTQKAELDYIQIQRLENEHFIKLQLLVDDLKEYLLFLKSTDDKNTPDELIIHSLKKKCYELDDFLRKNEDFKRLLRSFSDCLTQREVIIHNNETKTQKYQTYYGNSYEGFKSFGNSIKSKIDELEEKQNKRIIELNEYLANKSNLTQQEIDSFEQLNYTDVDKLVKLQTRKVIDELITLGSLYLSIPTRIRLMEYNNTLNSECFLNPAVKAYSNKSVGYRTFNFNIGNEYKAIINSNLGYGSASYFLLTISYKDVKLTPYSKYVCYYHANKIELHKYTKQAYLYDAEWGVIFQYIVDTYNLALANPDAFIDKYFIGELKQMVVGLENIAHPIHKKDFFEINEVEVYVARNENKLLRFAYGSIMFDYFQLEKISGALEYIESIEKIKEFSDVQNYIDRIIAVNKYILNTSKVRLERLQNETQILKDRIKKVKNELDSSNDTLNKLTDNKLEDIVKGKYTKSELKDIYLNEFKHCQNYMFEREISAFSKNLLINLATILLKESNEKSEFNKLLLEIDKLEKSLSELNSEHTDLENWISKFENGISIIEKYFLANSIN